MISSTKELKGGYLTLMEKFSKDPKLLSDIKFLRAKVYWLIYYGLRRSIFFTQDFKLYKNLLIRYYDECFNTAYKMDLFRHYLRKNKFEPGFFTCLIALNLYDYFENPDSYEEIDPRNKLWQYANLKVREDIAESFGRILRCSVCRTKADQVCKGCECELYCSEECQRAAWKDHKPICKARQEK